MYTKEQIQGNKETDKDKAVDLFALNGDWWQKNVILESE